MTATTITLSEDELCAAFAEEAKETPLFSEWLIRATKFADHATGARLLHEEQRTIRPRKHWWRHWWCHVPELNKDRETDIFLVYEKADGSRFACHVEAKLGKGRFEVGQAEGYEVRARHMANNPKYLNYSEYETILIAPQSFMNRYAAECSHFGVCISFEDLADRIAVFEM